MKLRCAGALSGAVDVGDVATVGELVAIMATRCECDGGDLKVIAGGRLLPADDSASLESIGVKATTRLVVSRVRRDPALEAQAARAVIEQVRADRLLRIEKAAETLANRTGGQGHRFELEDQDGDQLAGVSENDRKALTTGLTLHQKGRLLLDSGDFADALGVLELAEEAFGIADTALTRNLDNVPILHLDAAWAQFKEFKQNQQTTAAAAQTFDAGARRLRLCRDGFQRAHGPNLERLRAVHGGCAPELGLYVKLELLEGVLALRAGDVNEARRKLCAARDKRDTLTRVVSPDALNALASMGIDVSDAARALRFCDGNVDAAAAHVMDARTKAEVAAKAAAARRETERAARRFGLTEFGALVDQNALASMETLGFPRALAAEALRATENNSQAAMDTIAFNRESMEVAAMAAAAASERRDARHEARKRRRISAEPEEADDSEGEDGGEGDGDVKIRLSDENVDPHTALVGMGFDYELVRAALDAAGGDVIAAAEALTIADEDSAFGSGSNESDESDDDDSVGDEHATQDTEHDLVEAGKMCDDPLSTYDVDITEAGVAVDEFLALLPSEG